MPTTLPRAQNREWGYFGTISHHADPERAWDIVLAFIAGISCCSPDATRAFLDSRHGRHFADDVANELATGKVMADAIEAATTRWMAWRISARAAHETGIPRGLPYLTGYVVHAEIAADTND